MNRSNSASSKLNLVCIYVAQDSQEEEKQWLGNCLCCVFVSEVCTVFAYARACVLVCVCVCVCANVRCCSCHSDAMGPVAEFAGGHKAAGCGVSVFPTYRPIETSIFWAITHCGPPKVNRRFERTCRTIFKVEE
jgi:hypothetical protein